MENEKKQVELTCDIVGDLLPLYHDDVVSEGTKEAVERHLDTCEQCSKEYALLSEKLPENVGEEGRKKERQIRAFLNKVQKRGILKGIVVTVIAVVFMLGAGYVLTSVPIIKVPAKDVSVEYVFEDEGNFFIVYKGPQYKGPTMTETKYDKDKKQIYLNYKIPVIHFYSDQEKHMDILTLEKANLEQVGVKPENIFYNDKKIYSIEDTKNQKEAPEYVKVYFEYINSDSGCEAHFDENGIGLALLNNEIDGNAVTSEYKEWDWEGNLIYDGAKEE